MKNMAVSLAVFVVLAALAVPINAQSCTDVSFTVSAPQSTVALGTVFQVSISTTAGTPDDPWGNYINATLSLPSGLANISQLTANLTGLQESSNNWNVNSTTPGTYTMNATLSNTTGICEKSATVTITSDLPNIVATTTDLTEVFVNLASELNVTVTNIGNATATNVVIDLGSVGNANLDKSNQTLASLGIGETQTVTFQITPTNKQEYSISASVKYKDSINTQYSTTKTETFTAIGNILSSPTGSFLVGFKGQPINLVANVSQTIDASSATGLILTVESSENLSPNITIARYASVPNGTATGLSKLGKFFTVDSSSFNGKFKSASVKVSYSDSEVASASMQENTLSIFRYTPATNVWTLFTSSQDLSNNTIEANFSDVSNAVLGLFGLPSQPSAGSSATQTATINAGNSNLVNASAVDALLNITSSSTVTPAYFVITKYSSLTNGTEAGITAFGKYVKVEMDDNTRSKIISSMFRISYTDAELAAANLIESTLKIYRYNETTNTWAALTTAVDAANNFVETNVTGFSTFGLFGSPVPAPSTTSSGGGGVSSGGGSIIPPSKPAEPTKVTEPSVEPPTKPATPEETKEPAKETTEPTAAEPTATGGVPTGAFLTQNTVVVGVAIVIILAAAGYFLFYRRKK